MKIINILFFFLLTGIAANAQWTWLKGSNLSYMNGTYGTQGTPAAANNPGSREGSVSWKDAGGNLWLFGGEGKGAISTQGQLNDLWEYNPATNFWVWKKGISGVDALGTYGTKGTPTATTNPGGRKFAVSWADNNGNLWLFGGHGFGNSGFANDLNDLWKYNIAANQWTWMAGDSVIQKNGIYGIKGVPDIGNAPGGRNGACGWVDQAGLFWLFGGSGFPATGTSFFLNDLWNYNTLTNTWTWVNGNNTIAATGIYGTEGSFAPANMPGCRDGAVSCIDAAGKTYLFGGTGYAASNSAYGVLNDLWQYDPVINQWRWLSGSNLIKQYGIYGNLGVETSTNTPGSRGDATSWVDASGILWLFGGGGLAASFNSTGTGLLNDLWAYRPANNRWTWVKGDSSGDIHGIYGTIGVANAANKPGGHYSSVSWLTGSTTLWFFGGFGSGYTGGAGYIGDLWKIDIAGLLPVKLVSFNGIKNKADVLLQWETAQEINSSRFDVESSIDGVTFHTIGSVSAAGNSSTPRHYNFSETNAFEKSSVKFYRLNERDLDGHTSYSEVIDIRSSSSSALKVTVLTNPVADKLFINIYDERTEAADMVIINATGAVVAHETLQLAAGTLNKTIDTVSLETGVYYITVHNISYRSATLFVKR